MLNFDVKCEQSIRTILPFLNLCLDQNYPLYVTRRVILFIGSCVLFSFLRALLLTARGMKEELVLKDTKKAEWTVLKKSKKASIVRVVQ